jgi:hypothetical protein
MKIYIALAALACITAFSCKKNIAVNYLITGKWELREEVGGIAGKISYEPGKGTLWVFNSNGQFQTDYVNGPTISGSYQLQQSVRAGDYLLKLQYIQNGQAQARSDSVRFNKKQWLVLPFAACCDIPTSYYERLP